MYSLCKTDDDENDKEFDTLKTGLISDAGHEIERKKMRETKGSAFVCEWWFIRYRGSLKKCTEDRPNSNVQRVQMTETKWVKKN